jgi:transposase
MCTSLLVALGRPNGGFVNDLTCADRTSSDLLSGQQDARVGAGWVGVSGSIEAIRQLRVARDDAVKVRSGALCQLGDLIVTAPAELRESLRGRP